MINVIQQTMLNGYMLQTDFYRVQQQLAKGKPTPTLFTTTDEDFHAAIKRPISAAYSMSTLTEFEPFVDTTIHTLFKRLDEFVAQKKECDIALWLQYCMLSVGPFVDDRTNIKQTHSM